MAARVRLKGLRSTSVLEIETCPRDAQEIDGNLFIDDNFQNLKPGDLILAEIDEAGDYDLWGHRV